MCLLVGKIIAQLLYHVELIFIYISFFEALLILVRFLQFYLLRHDWL